jgi:serpin B
MMKRWMVLTLLITLCLGGAASAQESGAGSTMEAGNVAFALDLLAQLQSADGNTVVSPSSIQNAFWLAYMGADGTTGDQMSQVFRFPDLDNLAASSGMAAEPTPAPSADFTLREANALWAQQGFPWLPDYLNLAASMNAPVQMVDYTVDSEAVRQQINAWVESQTEDRIQDLIPPGVVDALTRLVIANAVYFKASWLYPFEPSLTTEMPFTLLDGTRVNVPMMGAGMSAALPYAVGEGYQAVALPYLGGNTQMLLIVPDAGQFAAFEARLNADLFRSITTALAPTEAVLNMPRFEFAYELSLKATLQAMGLTDAFDSDRADFSRMYDAAATPDRLYISDALHKAFIKVDEAGTEAAAATAIVIGVTSAPIEPPLQILIDRPFYFAIQDTRTDTLLFMGRVLNPGQ